ncbi:uncharacterized protein FOMMEDRAFT_21702 [Fomitiporia mediterranea MF3/22]|uniref:uncharacterized protein n=1 Tax=Fomitiporia mediterranea (strain MF3/22) TaxID=694068 RepID=UPI000440858F|nr:uncharacterized protein FOMMEDRAFT_21702 [Fomitiporia mediterranea MF3/22]EJD01283.1 hypothetical protein FOMMEDRAFT_21702 [Fomitiporia mediterranea MF3/22]
MGIRSMPWEEWVEVDNQLSRYHAIRVDRLARRGDKAIRTLPARSGVPGGGSAAKELVYELAEYLSRRYPDTYRVTRHSPSPNDYGWYGEGQVKEITIVPIDVTYNLDDEDPMKVSGLLVEDDLALMVEGDDGRYYFQAGAILVPGFWRMSDKLGMPLEDIHISGSVPQFREKLQYSMSRFFSKLSVDKPVIRNNYFFQIVRPADDPARATSIDPDELAWSDTTNGDEDHFVHPAGGTASGNQSNEDGNSLEPPPVVNKLSLRAQKQPLGTDTVDCIRFRTERQTLRRLPKSGAIAFTIRTYIFNVVDLAEEPGVPGRMASAIRSWPEEVQMYKGEGLYGPTILPYLDQKHAEQIRNGIIAEDDTTANYPY